MAKKKKETNKVGEKATKKSKKKAKVSTKSKPKKKTTSIEVCTEEWLRDYFKKGSKTGMTFAKVKGTEFVQLIHIDPKNRGHTKNDGTFVKGKTKFTPITIDEAIDFLNKRDLVVIRQVGGNRPNFFKIMRKSTAESKGLLKK